MVNPYINIFVCLAICFATFGGFRAFLFRNGINYVRLFAITTAYFIFITVVTAYTFRDAVFPVLGNAPMHALYVGAAVMLLLATLYVLLPRAFALPDDYLKIYPDRYFLEMGWKRCVAKSADILFQQLIIVLIVISLRDTNASFFQITAAFFVLFGVLHIPLVVSQWGSWPAHLFSGAVVVFSLLFPYLILLVPGGFIYSYLAHWLFYAVTATVFRVRFGTRTTQMNLAAGTSA